jgi:hypothetical protein
VYVYKTKGCDPSRKPKVKESRMFHQKTGGRLSKELHFSVERKSRGRQQPQPRERQGRTARKAAGSTSVSGSRTFVARCEPHDQRHSLIAASGLSLFVGQRIRRNDLEQMWDSVVIHCDELLDGTLAIRVLVSDPDWDELLQIAWIRSRPDDRESQAVLGCNLDHVSKPRTPYWLQSPD